MERKQCQFIDFCVEIIYEPVDCETLTTCDCSTARPRNIQARTRDEATRIVVIMPMFIHLVSDLPVASDCIKIQIDRTLMCAAGCRENLFSVPVSWCGTGMLIPPGEYTFTFPQQTAWGFPMNTPLCDDNNGGVVTLLLEPATDKEIQAATYNAAFRSCQ